MKDVRGLASKEGGFTRTGSRTPMQWNAGPNRGFSEAPAEKLYLPADAAEDAPDAESQAEDPESLLNTVKRLTALRRSEPDLCGNGPFELLFVRKKTYPIVYRRGSLTIAVNPAKRAEEALIDVKGTLIFSIGEEPYRISEKITMAPQSFAVFRV